MKMISIVVPCYNEEEVILMFYTELMKVINKIVKDNNLYEIIFVDDGSKDNTLKILKNIREKNKNLKIISFSRNFGKEAAIYAGLNSSVGEYVILMDSDLQHPPETIIEMIKEVENGYDMVATKRVNRDGEPIIKSWFSKLFYKIMKLFKYGQPSLNSFVGGMCQ